MSEQWVEVARAYNAWDASNILGAAEASNFAENEQGVLVIEFPLDILAGTVERISDLVQSTGVELWGDVVARGNKVYIYGRTTGLWVAAVLSVVIAVSVAATVFILYKVVEDVTGGDGGSFSWIILGVIAFVILRKN